MREILRNLDKDILVNRLVDLISICFMVDQKSEKLTPRKSPELEEMLNDYKTNHTLELKIVRNMEIERKILTQNVRHILPDKRSLDELYNLSPKEKKTFLQQMIDERSKNKDFFTMSRLQRYDTEMGIVVYNKEENKLFFSCYEYIVKKKKYYDEELNKRFLSKWGKDPWYVHLSELQRNFSDNNESIKDDEMVSVLDTPTTTYCLLVKHSTLDKYQIYIGQQSQPTRWRKSGTSHLSNVRHIHKGELRHDFSVCDMALSLFDPSQSLLFVIDHKEKEGELSISFPHYTPNKTIDMTKDKLSLSPIKGRATKDK